VKKVLATLILVVFLFNVGGYYLLFWGLDVSAKAKLAQRLNADDYSELETFEFKIPLNIPYPIQDRGFDRVAGEFEFNGEFYELVKQKYENDTLHIVCVKNKAKQKLTQVFEKYARVSNDADGAASNAGNDLLSKIVKDFNSPSLAEIVKADGWSRALEHGGIASAIIKMIREVISPPPNYFHS
jgi:hypothetical protein